MSQIQSIDDQIAKLEKTKAELYEAKESASDVNHWLSDAMLKFDHLVHNSTLYGQIYNVGFNASKELVQYFIEKLNDNNSLCLVDSTKGSGFYSYQQLPNNDHSKGLILKGDKTAKFMGSFQAIEKISRKGYKLEFYTQTSKGIVKISIDFMNIIIAEDYSTKARGNELPHLRENSFYTLDGKHGCKSLGVNGAYDTNNDLGYQHTIADLSTCLVSLDIK